MREERRERQKSVGGEDRDRVSEKNSKIVPRARHFPQCLCHFLSSIHDGIYNFAGVIVRPGNLSSARFVGYQPGLVVDHTFSPHFSSTAAYFYFFTGQFLRETPPAKGVGYFYAVLTFRL